MVIFVDLDEGCGEFTIDHHSTCYQFGQINSKAPGIKIVDLRAFETVRRNSGIVDSEVDGMCFSQCKREETQECHKGDPNHRVRLDKEGLETSGRLGFIATRYVISARTIQERNWKNYPSPRRLL